MMAPKRRNVQTEGNPWPKPWLAAVTECRILAAGSEDAEVMTSIAHMVALVWGLHPDELIAHWKKADFDDAKGGF